LLHTTLAAPPTTNASASTASPPGDPPDPRASRARSLGKRPVCRSTNGVRSATKKRSRERAKRDHSNSAGRGRNAPPNRPPHNLDLNPKPSPSDERNGPHSSLSVTKPRHENPACYDIPDCYRKDRSISQAYVTAPYIAAPEGFKALYVTPESDQVVERLVVGFKVLDDLSVLPVTIGSRPAGAFLGTRLPDGTVESPRFGTLASADVFIAVARDKFASDQRAAEEAKIAAKKAADEKFVADALRGVEDKRAREALAPAASS
jgi:hypothetical protein